MKTSNFANHSRQKFPGAISISRYPDKRNGFTGPEFPPLMPSEQLLRAYKDETINWEDYSKEYHKQLDCLDPQKTWERLHILVNSVSPVYAEPILLCYESAKTLNTNPCHRRLVAKWFEDSFGDCQVPEWTKGAV